MRTITFHVLTMTVLVVWNVSGACCQAVEPAEDASQDAHLVVNADKHDASPIHWVQEYNEARLKGIAESRPVLLFVTTDNCIYCEKMHTQTFGDASIVREVVQSFVPAQLKLEPESELAKQLRITIYPTTLIIASDGTILDYARGYLSTEDLQSRMSQAVINVDHIASLPASRQ